MAASRQVLPTKINLIRLRREYRAIRRIKRVLEEKRDVLLLYIRQTIDEYERSYKRVTEALLKAYEEFMIALGETGFDPIYAFVLSVPPSLKVNIAERVLFAVRVPALKLRKDTLPTLLPSPLRTTPRLVQVRRHLVEGMEALLRLVETEIALRKLIEELRSTQRLINAIDYQIIPWYESTIKYIKLVLDERMREEVIRLKMLKRKLEAKRRF